MKKKLLVLSLLMLFFYPNSAKAETIIVNSNGTVIVFKGVIHCKDIQDLSKEYSCTANAEIPSGNGILGWRKWIKDQYVKHTPYLKIRRGKVKIINNRKTLTYKKWLFGKRIIVGTIE